MGAALPAIVSTIRGLSAGVVPNGDRAVIAIRSYDVFTSRTPLVGQFSATTLVTHHVTHSLGPMLYWLLAVPARLGGLAAPAAAMGVVNAACAAGVVLLARRRGGPAFMVVVALTLVLMSRSLVGETWHDIWNPAAGVMPLTLLIFLCWSVACGEYRLLPVAVLVAGFTAQCELTFLLPSVGLLAVALVGLGRRAPLRWWLAAVVVAAICWSAPVVDQAVHRPGNLALVVRAAHAHEPTLGARAGWRAIVRAVSVPPWWLSEPKGPFGRVADIATAPSALSSVSCAAILAALVAAVVLGLRRRRRDVAGAALIGLVLCAGLAVVAAGTPTRHFLMTSLGYTMWWGSPAGMWVWLALGWSAGALWRPIRLPRPAFAPLLAVLTMLGAGTAVALSEKRDQDQAEYRPIRTVLARVDSQLPRDAHTIRVAGSPSFTAFDFKAPIMYSLRRRGLHPVAVKAGRRLGGFYEAAKRRFDGTVWVWDGRPRPGSGRVVARVGLGAAVDGAVTVTFAPRGAG